MATLKVLEDVVTTNALLYAYPEVKRAQAMAKKAGFTVKKNDGAGTLKVTTVVGEYKFQVRVHKRVCGSFAALLSHGHTHTPRCTLPHCITVPSPRHEELPSGGTNGGGAVHHLPWYELARATPSLWLDSLFFCVLLCSLFTTAAVQTRLCIALCSKWRHSYASA